MNKFLNLSHAKIVVTGHTGFKGTWLLWCLKKIGADIIGISDHKNFEFYRQSKIPIKKEYIVNITDYSSTYEIISTFKPDVIFHLAAQPLVTFSQSDPRKTVLDNVYGTTNVLDAAFRSGTPNIINVTTDKVYANNNNKTAFIESDQLGGSDIYSASKASVEIIAKAYFETFLKKDNINLANVRAGNVIGGGDFSTDRIIPDIVKAAANKQTLQVRSENAVRPWQHVLEPISGYLQLAERMLLGSVQGMSVWNFGPPNLACKTVGELIIEMSKYIEFHSENIENPIREASFLKLNSDKAIKNLGWNNRWSFEDTIYQTANWYLFYLKSGNLYDITEQQVYDYFNW